MTHQPVQQLWSTSVVCSFFSQHCQRQQSYSVTVYSCLEHQLSGLQLLCTTSASHFGQQGSRSKPCSAMFQARLPQGNLLKKLIDAIRDLITEGNVDVSEAGMQLQAMDTSHVCLIAFMLRSDGFEEFRWAQS